jgi:hypothetical protein
MNSTSTTFPRNEDKVTDWPVSPWELTVGSVKSGAPPEAESETDVYVTGRVLDVGDG